MLNIVADTLKDSESLALNQGLQGDCGLKKETTPLRKTDFFLILDTSKEVNFRLFKKWLRHGTAVRIRIQARMKLHSLW